MTMQNSVFTLEELTRWKTLAHTCINDYETFKELINTTSAHVLNGVVSDENLLFIACTKNSKSVKYLLECEKFTDDSINAINKMYGQTAILIACEFQSKAVQYLLESSRYTNASINAKSINGNTALIRACCYNFDSVKYLLNNGRFEEQTINAKNKDGFNALHMACTESNVQIVEYLLNCNKFTDQSINEITNEGFSVLYIACCCDTIVVEHLLKSEKLTIETIEAVPKTGKSALEYLRSISNKHIADDIEKYIKRLNDKSINNNIQEVKVEEVSELEIINMQLEIAELKQKIALMELANIKS